VHHSATAKVGQALNQLWTAWGCAASARYDMEVFESFSTYSAANRLVRETQRNRKLYNTASGVAKATWLQNPTLPDMDHCELIETLFLSPTTIK